MDSCFRTRVKVAAWAVGGSWALLALLVGAAIFGSASPARAADLALNVYGDIDYMVTSEGGARTNSFQTPRVELFTSASQDRLSFLAETMFEVGEDNAFAIDVERIEVGYLFGDTFRLRAGRFHSAIGYYNDAYHHGRYFQTTVDRPFMTRFEDEGGLLPAHAVGLHADGRFPLGRAGSLRYDVDVANGRGRTPGEVTNAVDPNNGKMLNLRLRLEPSLLEGLIVGGNVMTEGITALNDPLVPDGATTFVREMIFGAHAVYLENNVHAIAEWLYVSHKANGARSGTQGAFLELGYSFNRLLPYVRGEWVKFPSADKVDPFYATNALFILSGGGRLAAGVVGVKLTVSDYLALKWEGQVTAREHGATISSGALQCAFAF